jgi:hypothetical protein
MLFVQVMVVVGIVLVAALLTQRDLRWWVLTVCAVIATTWFVGACAVAFKTQSYVYGMGWLILASAGGMTIKLSATKAKSMGDQILADKEAKRRTRIDQKKVSEIDAAND